MAQPHIPRSLRAVDERDAPPLDPRVEAIPDIHGHAKGEHKPFIEERPIPYTARMLFLWFFHACRRGSPRFLMVADHMNYLTFEDPAAVNLVRRALKLAHAGDLYGASETAGIELQHAAVVSEGLRKGMRYSIGAEVDNDPRSRPDAQNIVDAMRPDAMIRSVHFLTIDHPEHGAGWQWPFDNPEFKHLYDHVGVAKTWELYMATLLDAIDKLPGNIIGHFYAPAKFGHWPDDATLDKYEDQLVAACATRGMAIEINARFFYRYFADEESQKRRYRNANLRLLKKAKARGVGITVGSDAHSPKDQGNAFGTILEMLDKAGINEIVFPVEGRMARVALRATEAILKQKAAPPPPPIGSSVSGFTRAELVARNGGFMAFEPELVGGRKRSKAAQAAALKASSAKAVAAKKGAAAKKAVAAKKLAPAKKVVAAKKVAPLKKIAKKPVLKKKPAPPKRVAVKKAKPVKKVALKKAAHKAPALKKAVAKKKPPVKRPPPKRSAPKPAPKKKSKARR